MYRNLGLFLAVLQLSACVSLQQTVAVDAAPVPNSGYVVGSFTTPKGTGFGFGIVNTETGLDYVMQFGEDTLMPTERKDQLGM